MNPEISRLVITLCVSGLTIGLLALIYQTFLILKELVIALRKVNKSLDDVNTFSQSVLKPILAISNFVTGIKESSSVIKKILK